MTKTNLTYLFLIISMLSFGMHKDIIVRNKFGNIKTTVKTGFKNYGETKKVEIFGLLAKELCEKLSFKDTIVIDFRHNYTNSLPKILILEYGNLNREQLFLEDYAGLKEYQEDSYSHDNLEYGICLRILDTTFNIKENLKLLEYSLKNKIHNSINTVTYQAIYDNPQNEIIEISYYGLLKEKIDEVLKIKDSDLLIELLKSKVKFTETSSCVKGFYENEKYFFTINDLEYSPKELVYLIESENGTFVFDSPNSFVFLDSNIKQIKSNFLEIDGDYPFYTTKRNFFKKNQEVDKNEIILYRGMKRAWAFFSLKRNKIIKVEK